MHRLLPVVLLLAACSNKLHGGDVREPDTDRGLTDTADSGDTGPVDHDGDGYFEGDGDDADCDDYDADIHPGAPELCNGIDDDCDGQLSDEEIDQDGDGEPECEEVCAPIPGATGIPMRSDCEFTPSPSGTPFSARIEWAMTHEIVDPSDGTVFPAYTFADEPDFTSVFQAPVVGQATDDDASGTIDSGDKPDIAIVMADTAESTDGVLRLISGDGTAVLASTHWQTFSNRNGTYDYAPYHYAGVAMANIDADSAVEILTLVIRQQDGLCYPADPSPSINRSTPSVDSATSAITIAMSGRSSASTEPLASSSVACPTTGAWKTLVKSGSSAKV